MSEASIARLEERSENQAKEIERLAKEVADMEKRMDKAETVLSKNTIVISYVERVGWAVVAAVMGSIHWVKQWLES